MDSIKLWSVTFPNQTNIMSKSVKTLRANSQDKPYVRELVWLVDKRVVKVVLEAHEEMPNVAMIPQESLSVIVPMPKEATKAKLPDETVSSSKFSKDGVVSDEEWVKDKGVALPASPKTSVKTDLSDKDRRHMGLPKAKPKPKKRGRKPGSKNKKKG